MQGGTTPAPPYHGQQAGAGLRMDQRGSAPSSPSSVHSTSGPLRQVGQVPALGALRDAPVAQAQEVQSAEADPPFLSQGDFEAALSQAVTLSLINI
mgnify:CR=1 FL=1